MNGSPSEFTSCAPMPKNALKPGALNPLGTIVMRTYSTLASATPASNAARCRSPVFAGQYQRLNGLPVCALNIRLVLPVASTTALARTR